MTGTKNKSIKTAPTKAAKTSAKSSTNAGGNANTVDAEKNILEHLFTDFELGKEEVSEVAILATSGYARTDSTGYRKIMKDLTQVRKFVVKKNKALSLTEAGVRHMQSLPSDRPKMRKDNKSVEEFYKDRIIKTGKGKIPANKLDLAWDLLCDRQPHAQEELLDVLGYKRPDSTGYKLIMKALKEAELVKKEGRSFRFVAEKVFPYEN